MGTTLIVGASGLRLPTCTEHPHLDGQVTYR